LFGTAVFKTIILSPFSPFGGLVVDPLVSVRENVLDVAVDSVLESVRENVLDVDDDSVVESVRENVRDELVDDADDVLSVISGQVRVVEVDDDCVGKIELSNLTQNPPQKLHLS